MRIAIVNLTHGGLSGGYRKYLEEIVPRLLVHPAAASIDVFVPRSVTPALENETWPVRPFDARAPGGLRDLEREVLRLRPDVVFVPTARWMRFGAVPVAVMVRNMEPLEIPLGGNPLREALKNLARRGAARRACRRARRVVAVSRHVRDFLTSRWSVPEGRIGVVYHGVRPAEAAPAAARPAALAAAGGPFLFTAGSIRPARGLADLVEALARLRRTGRDVTVVHAGAVDAGMDAHAAWLRSRAQQLGVADRLIYAGPMDAAAMRWCFERAAAFVMTSRAEACPNIALEAMSYGAACISVDRQPMPEFFERSARYYQAGDADALSRAVEATFAEPEATAALRAAAVARAGTFDWDASASRTMDELRRATSQPLDRSDDQRGRAKN